MPQPNTQQVTAQIDTSVAGDQYATHWAARGKGGYRVVADNTERDAITTPRRETGMLVYALDSGITYILEGDLTTWTVWNSGITPSDIMLKSVYDPNDDGVVTDSDNLDGQPGTYYLSRVNHTGVQAQSTITNLTTDLALKEDKANKGVAGGYVPLNGSILIDNAYLGFSLPLDPVIAWNPVTNTPSISDAGGSAGEIYVVYDSANPTARDLGSGSINWNDGDAAIYDSGTSAFVKVAQVGVGVSQVTTDLGVQTGPVTIDDTSYIAPSTDRNYVTDDEDDALNAATTPSASNPYATISDITSAIVLGVGRFGPEIFADGQTLGNGTLRTLTSLGYTNGTAATAWPRVNSAYTIDVTTMDIDWITWQEALLTIGQTRENNIIAAGGRCYTPYTTLTIPDTQAYSNYSEIMGIDLGYSLIKNNTGTPFIMFDRYPVNQAEAAGGMANWRICIRNGRIIGISSADPLNVGLRLGACSSSLVDNIKFNNFGTAADFQFCLQLTLNKVDVNNIRNYGIKVHNGQWSGVTATNANSTTFVARDLHFYVGGGGYSPTAVLYCQGNTAMMCDSFQCEGGGTPEHIFYYDQLNNAGTAITTTAKNIMRMTGVYIEQTLSTRAAFRMRGGGNGVFQLDTLSCDTIQPAMVELDTSWLSASNGLYAFIRNSSVLNIGKLRNVRNPGAVFTENFWDISRVQLPNNGTILDPTNWATDFGGTIPAHPANRVRFLERQW